MKNFYIYLQSDSRNICFQIGIFAFFNLIVYLFLFWAEYSDNQSYAHIILISLAITICLIWSFYQKLYKYLHFGLIYISMIYALSFLPCYMIINTHTNLWWQYYFLVVNCWLAVFSNISSMVGISTVGIIAALIFSSPKALYNVPQGLWDLILALCLIFTYAAFYKRQLFIKNQPDINRLLSSPNDIIESKNSLINNVIHEIRNPLHGLLNISTILKNNPHISKIEISKQISIIYETTNYLSKLTDELLHYAKFNAGKIPFNYSNVDLIAVINQSIKHTYELYLYGKNLKIIFPNNDFQEAWVRGDELKIQQVLINLLTNAIKYSEKGVITIQIEQIVEENKQNFWKITVMDQGIGIQEKDLENIFSPFVRSPNAANMNPGTGLGLSFCREIILAHNGLIWAKNNKNSKGANFIFTLPVLENHKA